MRAPEEKSRSRSSNTTTAAKTISCVILQSRTDEQKEPGPFQAKVNLPARCTLRLQALAIQRVLFRVALFEEIMVDNRRDGAEDTHQGEDLQCGEAQGAT